MLNRPVGVDIHWNEAQRGLPLARRLYESLVRVLSSDVLLRPGPGIPVRVGVSVDDLRDRPEGWRRRLVVLLLDSSQAPLPVEELQQLPHTSVLRVWLDAAPQGPNRGVRAVDEGEVRVIQHVIGRLCALLDPSTLKTPVFVSHVPGDAGSTHDLVDRLTSHLEKQPMITPLQMPDSSGREWLSQRRPVMLCLRSDAYDNDPRCRRDVLAAKALQLPIVTVMCLQHGQPRSLAYGGNHAVLPADAPLDEIALQCLTAWLHRLHFGMQATSLWHDLAGYRVPVTSLAQPPELLDAVRVASRRWVMYPDPPLVQEELDLIRAVAPHTEFTTPVTLFANTRADERAQPESLLPLSHRRVAISLSDSPDVANLEKDPTSVPRAGVCEWHLDDAIAHVTLAIAGCGAQVAYGGRLVPGYTHQLGRLLRDQRRTMSLMPLSVYVPPTNAPAATEDLDLYRVDVDIASHAPDAAQYTAMRRQMAADCDANVCVGGKTTPRSADPEGYGGRYPGIVEEAWSFAVQDRPLYVLGGFAGAAGWVAALLRGEPVAELDDAQWSNAAAFVEMVDAHAGWFEEAPTMKTLADDLVAYGRRLMADPRVNGLTWAENLCLFTSTDALELAALVTKGLANWNALNRQRQLAIHIVHGNLVDRPADAYLVGSLEGAIPTGADRDLGVSDTQVSDIEIAPLEGRGRARYRVQLSLGTRAELDAQASAEVGRWLEHRVRAACQRFLRDAAAGGLLQRVAAVPLGAGSGLAPDRAALAMLESLLAANAHDVLDEITIVERRPERFRRVLEAITQSSLPHDPRVVIDVQHAELDAMLAEPDLRMDIKIVSPDDPLSMRITTPHRAIESPATSPRSYASLRDSFEFLHADFDHSLRRGRRLAEHLFDEATQARIRRHGGSVEVHHQAPLADLPLEMLVFGEGPAAFVPAIAGFFHRRPLGESVATTDPDASQRPRVVLVVDPENDLPHALGEGHWLLDRLMADGHFDVVPLFQGEATRIRVLDALGLGSTSHVPTILHYCGHVRAADGGIERGLALADGMLLGADLEQLVVAPRFVFLNACGASERTAGIATEMLRAGVTNLIGTRWPVMSAAAKMFAERVYTVLSERRTLGEAVGQGRRMLFDGQHRDWCNYQLYGDARNRVFDDDIVRPERTVD